MGYELIITEKPAAAKKIAEALADGKLIRETENKVAYYKVTHKGKDLIIACAVGHLYSVAEKEKTFNYPSFEIEWVPASEVDKNASYSKKYLTVIKKLAKKAESFTVACDYDIEGEVIGLNIILLACKQKDAQRMKFSTLTKPDLVQAYATKQKTIDWGQAKAGETRHFLDWLYGINLSRALITSIKKAGRYKTLSIGRVQGPALKLIVNKEKEIKKFVPVPYWQLQLLGALNKNPIEAWHEKDKFQNEKECLEVLEKTKGKDGKLADISAKQFSVAVPVPFDLTTLQTEAYRSLGINPKQTLEIAQNLYLESYISYPRTSSQKIPKTVGIPQILSNLTKNKEYTELAKKILSGKMIPNEGKKTDPAHPSIFPTGLYPKVLDGREKKVYDLIVRRFLSVFGEPATRETVTLKIDVEKEIFLAKGTRTVKKGWHQFYQPHLKLEEQTLPEAKIGDTVNIKEIIKHDKETQPPKRFSPASLI
ncbi:DNA topoisomerase I, partial [Candidatus Woesearchaeota archaeon]|nr:DNA topoisomerase I [Candidatus Woesearchaeota archaeon]